MRSQRGIIMIVALAAYIVCSHCLRTENGNGVVIPALPVDQHKKTCRLDLSAELFGGVREACGEAKTLERSRCCPVLAAWLYAAHAKTALQPPLSPPASADLPVLPDDSQTCVNTLQESLNTRGIQIPRPNATCDVIICFCGIRLHHLTSLTCPAALNLGAAGHNVTTTHKPAVRALETNCSDPSHKGCTRCLNALHKLKGKEEGDSDRDCEIMGLTWLLARNKTAYIPTVSAVIRALMFSNHSPRQSECSPDRQNMPLAVDSAELYRSSSAAASVGGHVIAAFSTGIFLLLPPLIKT